MDTTATSPAAAPPSANILVDGDSITIRDLGFADTMVAEHLASLPVDRRGPELVRAIAIGVHGLTATSMRATVDEMQHQVRRIIATAVTAAEQRLDEAVKAGHTELSAHLDPEVRSSLTARTVAELGELHQATLARLDPDRIDSHTGKLVSAITDLLGPGGLLAQRLEDALDSADAERGLGRLLDSFEKRFQEIRDLLVGEQHRKDEAQRGTAKGVEFEDQLEELLRTEARSMRGCIVERTSHAGGTLGVQAKVGDFTVSLPDGTRIVIEAKNTASVGLTGSSGILTELDTAMDNRNATWAICVSRGDAFPAEVGSFGVYGNRLLVVDGGDGVLTSVALRWVAAAARSARAATDEVDTVAAIEKLDRIRSLAQHFSRSKKVLSNAQSSIEAVRDDLDTLRTDLLGLVDEVTRSLNIDLGAARRVA